jgi:putative tryptophan/tyrosine transport system substrate-binding protein
VPKCPIAQFTDNYHLHLNIDMPVRTLLIILLLRCCLPQVASAQDGGVLVLYPEATAPYQAAYEQIIDGLRSLTREALRTRSIAKDYDQDKLQEWLDDNKKSATYLVVLGQQALQASKLLTHQLQIVASAMEMWPGTDQIPGVSIRIHPAIYLERLQRLSPQTTRLLVFYRNNNDDALISVIEKAAHQRGIAATPILVTDVTTAVRQITAKLKEADPETTAIWFTRNVIEINTELLFPYILEASWNRRIAVFSNIITHTKRGFLFSLYPDYRGIGKELGLFIAEHRQKGGTLEFKLTRAAKFVLNTRTAQHLGLLIDDTLLQSVDVSFPGW